MDMSEQYANNPHLAACARKLDASLRPINDAILARLGLTRDDLRAGVVVPSIASQASAPTPIADTDPTKKEAA